MNKDYRFLRFEGDFNWLIDAGVALPTYNVTEFETPLLASKKSNLFKLFLSDVGLLSSLFGKATILKLLSQGKSINCGAIFENFVCQELTANGFKTFYFNSKKHGKVDFLVECDDNLLPLEIKSGKDYQIHSALSYFSNLDVFPRAIVFSTNNTSTDKKIVYYPIYMTMFLSSNERIGKIKPMDLSLLSELVKKDSKD